MTAENVLHYGDNLECWSPRPMTSREADFSESDRIELAKRVGYHCSKPRCNRLTVGPGKLAADKAVNVGKAAHITAASPGGPRYDPNMSGSDAVRDKQRHLALLLSTPI